jgi:hypothetical protein
LWYLVAIAVLLFPLGWLSAPAFVTEQGMNQGGKLAQLRDEYRLGQANLGEIDPASETMKLATLGLRGVAMNLLWEKANHYKKTEDWSNLTATLDQLSKLQPNFITFWKFQSWNISYNLSVEFDDYHDRYAYVRRGIEFLKKGESYNKDNPHLLWDLGWFIGQKIGRADEHVQYRRLFRTDDDFHPDDRPPERRDNWLVGKEWYLRAVDAVDNKGHSIGKKSPKVFFSSPVMSQINYSEAIEKEGNFPRARRGWALASSEWHEFGERVIEHSTGVPLQLNDEPRLEVEKAELVAKLDAYLPDVRDKVLEEKRAALAPELLEANDTPREERTERQVELASQAYYDLQVSHRNVADYIVGQNPELNKEIYKLTEELERVEQKLRFTQAYKRDANFDYWELRCNFEQTPEALRAREKCFLGKKAFEETDLRTAKARYDEGFAAWRQVLDEYPALLDEETTTGDDLLEYVEEYRRVLEQLDGTLDEDFPLWDVVENFDLERKFAEELAEHKRRQAQAGVETATDDTVVEPVVEPNGEAVEESVDAPDGAPVEDVTAEPSDEPATDAEAPADDQ